MRHLLGDYQLFKDGSGLVSLCEEVTLPDIKWKEEDYSGGGLIGTRQMKTILEKLEVKAKSAGYEPELVSAVGQMPGMSQNYKIMASFIVPGGVEIPQKVLITGAMSSLKRDAYKPGKSGTEYTISDITFYEEWFDGVLKFGIDLLNQKLVVDGVDLMAVRRRNTGRA
ncbi:MAG: phage major tail tube protein [Hyphomicrobiaceae bacterium]